MLDIGSSDAEWSAFQLGYCERMEGCYLDKERNGGAPYAKMLPHTRGFPQIEREAWEEGWEAADLFIRACDERARRCSGSST